MHVYYHWFQILRLTPHLRASIATCRFCKINVLGDLQKHCLDHHVQTYPVYINGISVSILRSGSSQGLSCTSCSFSTPSFFGLLAHLGSVHQKHVTWLESEFQVACQEGLTKERKRSLTVSQNGATPK